MRELRKETEREEVTVIIALNTWIIRNERTPKGDGKLKDIKLTMI